MDNMERVKTDLLAIIKEAQNLKPEELVTISGTNIKIKAGREREFQRLCDSFYEVEFNQKIENDTDTITPVYEFLNNLVKEENEEYFREQAYQFATEVHSSVEQFSALKKTLKNVERTYELTRRELTDLYLKRSSSPEWQQKVGEKNEDIKTYGPALANINEKVLSIKKSVNDCLLKYVDAQMKSLRDNFTHTTVGTEKVLAADKETFILASDEKEYNSLYVLSQILKVANAKDNLDDLEIFEGSMIITKDQREIVETLLPNIRLFHHINPNIDPHKESPRDVNQKLIDKITAELRRIEERVNTVKGKKVLLPADNQKNIISSDLEEYNNLLKALKYLNTANNSKWDLASVWNGKAYVLGTDVPAFENLMRSIKFGKDLDPDTAKKEQNEKLIEELSTYLDELADKVSKKQGVANLPIKSTKTVGDRAWVVLEDDLQEANRIVDIISLLQKQSNHLIDVWGMANLESDSIAEFKKLANGTRYLGVKIPNTPANEKEIKKLEGILADLIRTANNTENAKLADNGLVLESDLETYKLLEEKYKYLEAAKTSDDLELVDGVQIDSQYARRYHEINELLKKKLNPELNPPIPPEKTPNEIEIEKITARMNEIAAKSDPSIAEREEFDLLREKLDILEKSKDSQDLEPVDGVMIAKELAPRYHEINEELHQILNPPAPDLFEKNNLEIEKAKARMAELEEKAKKSKHGKMASNGKVLKRDEKEYLALEEKIKYLEEAKTSQSVVDVDGVKIPSNREDEYLAANKITKKKSKKIVSIRKLKDLPKAAFNYWKTNWKQIVALGVCLGMTVVVLPKLIPAIVFANSCTAMAASSLPVVGPTIVSGLNALSAALAPIAGGSVGLMSNGAAVNLAWSSVGNALVKLGIIGGTGFLLKKNYDTYMSRDEHGLRDPNRKSVARKLIDLGENFKSSINQLLNTPLEHNEAITQTDLANAQIEYEANQENLTGEGLTMEEIVQHQVGEDVSRFLDEGGSGTGEPSEEEIETLEGEPQRPPVASGDSAERVLSQEEIDEIVANELGASASVSSTGSAPADTPERVLSQDEIDEIVAREVGTPAPASSTRDYRHIFDGVDDEVEAARASGSSQHSEYTPKYPPGYVLSQSEIDELIQDYNSQNVTPAPAQHVEPFKPPVIEADSEEAIKALESRAEGERSHAQLVSDLKRKNIEELFQMRYNLQYQLITIPDEEMESAIKKAGIQQLIKTIDDELLSRGQIVPVDLVPIPRDNPFEPAPAEPAAVYDLGSSGSITAPGSDELFNELNGGSAVGMGSTSSDTTARIQALEAEAESIQAQLNADNDPIQFAILDGRLDEISRELRGLKAQEGLGL